MNDREFIGVFDSGVGGLSVWREIVRLLPHENILYLADQAHVPYGDRSLNEVCDFAEEITRFLLKRGAKIIVIASNTTSAAALYHLRDVYPNVPFVGMEPAIKPAVERTRRGVVGVIATPATFQGELFASLVERYAGDVQIFERTCPRLVEAVERGALNTPDTMARLREYLVPLVEAGMDQLVLGCTHYPFLRLAIEELLGEDVIVIDPAPAVARQTARVLAKNSLETEHHSRGIGQYLFYTSGDVARFAAMIKQLIPSLDEGILNVCAIEWRKDRLVTFTPSQEN